MILDKTACARVLVVDDDLDIRTALISLMPDNILAEGAASAAGALGFLRVNRYDLVLCDLHIENFNGLDILRNLRKDEIATPFVLISGFLSREVLNRAKALGVMDIIEKPVSPDEIIEKIDSYLRLLRKNIG